MATAHMLSGVAMDAPIAQSAIAALEYEHGLFTKPFDGVAGIDTFESGAIDWSNLIQGALPLERTRDATEITLLSGQKILGDAPVTVPDQTAKALVRLGMQAYSFLQDYDYTLPGSPYAGAWFGFARTYPDGNVLIGESQVRVHTPEGDPAADAFGYNVTWGFRNVRYWDGRRGVAAPTYTATGSTTTGTATAEQTINGTNLLNVTSVDFRTAGGVLVKRINRAQFTTHQNNQIKFTPTAGMTAATYNRVLVAPTGEVAAGTYQVS